MAVKVLTSRRRFLTSLKPEYHSIADEVLYTRHLSLNVRPENVNNRRDIHSL